MVLGSYYLTYERYPEHTPGETYEDCDQVRRALADGELSGDDYIWVKNPGSLDDIPVYASLAAETPEGELPRELSLIHI